MGSLKTIDDVTGTSPEAIKLREKIWALVAMADNMEILVMDIKEALPFMELDGLSTAIGINKTIVKGFDDILDTEVGMKNLNNFELVGKAVMKIAKNTVK